MTTSLILFLALAVAPLVIVSLVNERDRRRRVVNKKLREMKRRVQEMEELVLEVDQLVENKSIAQFINDEILAMISAMRQANPEASNLDASYQTALLRGETLSDELTETPLDRLKESDAQIARAQKTLEETAIILRRQQAMGKLGYEQMSAYLTDLSWAHLMTAVVSHVGQGHKSVRRGDILSAHAFYKKAQQMLMQSSHPDPRRHNTIKELSEIMNSKRVALSPSVMPETHLNPPPKAVEPEAENTNEEKPESQNTPSAAH